MGIGRRPVDRCLDSLRQAGIEKCAVVVFNSNANGIAFWEQVGWARRGDVSMIARNVGQFLTP